MSAAASGSANGASNGQGSNGHPSDRPEGSAGPSNAASRTSPEIKPTSPAGPSNSRGNGPPGPQTAPPAPPVSLPAAKKKKRKTPSVLFQRDVHARHGASLALAERADESLDRILLVSRFVLQLCADIIRPSTQLEHSPLLTMGSHVVGQRQLGPQGPGTVLLYLQEMAFFEGEQVEPYCRRPEGSERVFLDLKAHPKAKVKGRRLSKVAAVRVRLNAQCRIVLPRHQEEYFFMLPDLWIHSPMTDEASLDLLGDIKITSPANGLTCSLSFKQNAQVKGAVTRLDGAPGSRSEKVCDIEGAWDGEVHASSSVLGAQGLVFSAAAIPGQPSINKNIDLKRFGPRQLPRLWVVLHDALYGMKDTDASSGGAPERMLQDIRKNISDLSIRRQAGGLGSRAGQRQQEELTDSDSDDDEGHPPRNIVQVPPCIWAIKKAGRSMWWRLQYRVLLISGPMNRATLLPMVDVNPEPAGPGE